MNYFKRTFFFFLFLLLVEVFLFKNLPFFLLILLSVSFAILGAFFVHKSFVSTLNELKTGLKRIRNSDFVARLDDVKGKDLNEIGYEFNLLANELQEYKFRFEKREKELLSLINSIPQGLILFDENSKVVVSNQTILTMFPYFNSDAPLASLSIPLLNSFLNKAKEENISQKEILSESGKGRGRVFEITYIPLYRNNWALSIVDVSVEKNLEKIKYDLVANVSHELRTPMSAISSMMDVIEEEQDPERKKEFLSRIRNQVDRINALLNDLLSLSRIEGGDYELKFEKINIKNMVEQILVGVDNLIKRKGITLDLNVDENLEINSDYVLLESILKNIIENGIKYNRESGKLTVTARQSEQKLIFEVEDTGEGVPEEYRERIFERFFRIDEHRSKNSGGTGLGLSIVKHSVKLLKGEIELKSEIGQGSKFIIKIPNDPIVAKSQ